jgi:hypothetical protein
MGFLESTIVGITSGLEGQAWLLSSNRRGRRSNPRHRSGEGAAADLEAARCHCGELCWAA